MIMFDSESMNLYLAQKKILCAYQIWTKKLESGEFQLSYSYSYENVSGESPVIRPPDKSITAPAFEQWFIQNDVPDGQYRLWLKYPEGHLFIICFSRIIALEDIDYAVLYHMIYPLYSEQAVLGMKTSSEERLQMLARSNEIYSRLAEFSLKNMGVEKITHELRHIIGLPMIFADLTNDEHYPKNKKLPVCLKIDHLTSLFSKDSKPLYLDPEKTGKPVYYIYPIFSGTACLGCFIVSLLRQLSQLDHVALEQGGTITALELVKKRSLTELYYRKAYQIFDELMQNNDPSLLAIKCNELGIDINADYICVVLAYTTNIDLEILEACVQRLVSRIKKELADIYQTVFYFHNKVTLLASLQNASDIPRLLGQLEEIILHSQRNENVSLCAGMGSLYRGAASIFKSYGEANKALSYQISHHKAGVVQYSQIGINRLFINLPTEDAAAFLREIFNPLRSISKNQNNDLEQTLTAYIEANCSAARTAERLYIHINTFYQRLKKIEDCLQISFNNPEDVLRLKLACYLKPSYSEFDKNLD